jgi:hypothetical protein
MSLQTGNENGVLKVSRKRTPGELIELQKKSITQLQTESVDTMLALTEVYETNSVQDATREQEGVDTMLALTEAYELILIQQDTIADLTARIEALETGGGN